MANTFNVISLGNQTDLDTVEGNSSAEGASDMVGLTFGSGGSPLCEQIQTFSPGSTGYTGGTSDVYDLDNSPNETFSIDGGPDQTFDGIASFVATVTYTDGTTANISAVLFQDTQGNTYLAPEFSANSDQTKLEAKPIESLSLDSVAQDYWISGLIAERETGNFMVCFVEGTELDTPSGPVAVERLSVGDSVSSLDNGPQSIRWIGSRTVAVTAAMRPVRIRAGALGNGLPTRDLRVSQQHRIMTRSRVADRMFGQAEALIAAKKLVGLPGIAFETGNSTITYWHILCNRHEIVMANGAPAETLLAGAEACSALGEFAVRGIIRNCPDLAQRFNADVPARSLPSPRAQKSFAMRLLKNGKSVIEPEVSQLLTSRLAIAS